MAELLEWRWAPAAALSLGAMVYVAVAVAVIPERIETTSTARSDNRFLRGVSPPTTALYAARIGETLETRADEPEISDPPPALPVPQVITPPTPVVHQPEQRRGFSPPLPRPEPEPPPPPPVIEAPPAPPPQPEAPPAAPASPLVPPEPAPSREVPGEAPSVPPEAANPSPEAANPPPQPANPPPEAAPSGVAQDAPNPAAETPAEPVPAPTP